MNFEEHNPIPVTRLVSNMAAATCDKQQQTNFAMSVHPSVHKFLPQTRNSQQ